jgi:hypothetical protein
MPLNEVTPTSRKTSEERVGQNPTLILIRFNKRDAVGEGRCGCAEGELGWELGLLDHHFSGFDDRADGVAYLQFHFLSAGASDDAFDEVVADTNGNVGHDVAELDFGDFAD